MKPLSGHILKIELHASLFWAALAEVRRETPARQIGVEPIKRDTSADMMRALFGIGLAGDRGRIGDRAAHDLA